MAPLRAGVAFPDGIVFSLLGPKVALCYVPYTEDKSGVTACGIPINYDASKEFKNKKVVLFAVPGAFTPTCTASHLPGYIENLSKLKAKGVDVVGVLGYNDAWVMSAWGKASGVKKDDILFLSDPNTKFSKSIGWTQGDRTGRYAIIVDHGKVTYAEVEPGNGVTVSGADAVLANL